MFKNIPLLGRLKMWLKRRFKKIMYNFHFGAAKRKRYEELISKYLCTINTFFLSTINGLSVSLLHVCIHTHIHTHKHSGPSKVERFVSRTT
jgi:hypothetical protein